MYYPTGRQGLSALIIQNQWKRIWIPEFYYADFIEAVAQTGIQVRLYEDYFSNNDEAVLEGLPTKPGDVLLRVNYFGLRGYRSEADFQVPVVEDHTCDMLGQWATNSNADYCFASLREAYPFSQGAIVWCPKMCHLDKGDAEHTIPEDILRFDMPYWNVRKMYNWSLLNQKLKDRLHIVQPEKIYCLPFFFVILAQDKEDAQRLRDCFKRLSINTAPPMLLPGKAGDTVRQYNERLVFISCDGRYSAVEMAEMAELISIFV